MVTEEPKLMAAELLHEKADGYLQSFRHHFAVQRNYDIFHCKFILRFCDITVITVNYCKSTEYYCK